MGLLVGCANGAKKITHQQRASISSISIETAQTDAPLLVEYPVTDTTGIGVSAGLIGIVVSHALDAPGNTSSKMQALIKARAFNQLVGSFNSTNELSSDLAGALAHKGYKVLDRASTTLDYQMTNCLSQDTKTLQVYTKYKLFNAAGKLLQSSRVRVQYSVAAAWNRDKLQTVRRSAVRESAQLIAMDISGDSTMARHDQGVVEIPASDRYMRSKDSAGFLISAAAESDDLHIRHFLDNSGNCNQERSR